MKVAGLILNTFCRKRFISPNFIHWRTFSTISFKVDRYKGIHIDVGACLGKDGHHEQFFKDLKDSIEKWKVKEYNSIWLRVPIELSDVIPLVANVGFTYHHANGDHSVLSLWINDRHVNRIPAYATHQVGVAGCCVDESTKSVLVVRDRGRFGKYWKFPGGLSDLSEDFHTTAVREVFEETGIHAEYQSIIALRQHHDFPQAFGNSDLFVVTRLTPLTFKIEPCNVEIEACKWIPVAELLSCTNITPITKCVSQLITHGLQHGFHEIDFVKNHFQSVYKGQTYWMHHSAKLNLFKEYNQS